MLALSAILRGVTRSSEALDADIKPVELQRCAMQCLTYGRFATANAHALEAFLLHLQCQLFIQDNSSAEDPWFEMGTIIRLAFRMGYHRDPKNLPRISVFDGEMRRRVWLNIVQIEALMSYQTGFPSMIPMDFCDTDDPKNLQFADLQEDMTTEPAARPLSEDTPVTYTLIKNGVMKVFKRIVAHTQSLNIPTYADTMALDAEMRQKYSKIPELFQPRTISRSFMDTSDLIFQRTTIEILHFKGLILLHRRYITHEPQSSAFALSRGACLDAADGILARQADLHQACAPGGRLQDDKSMFLALPIHDFLLAVMIISLDLSTRLRLGLLSQASIHDLQTPTGKQYQALKKASQIWSFDDTSQPETRVAALAIDIMVKKLAAGDPQTAMEPAAHKDPQLDISFPCEDPIMQLFDGDEMIDWVCRIPLCLVCVCKETTNAF